MPRKYLLETSFLLALNPNDRNHDWAMELLSKAKKGELKICISPAAPIEISLMLRSRGVSDDVIAEVLKAMDDAISLYTEPEYCSLTLRHLAYAAELRSKYQGLTFFDSVHAAVTITNRLIYLDLDSVVRNVVASEIEH